MKSNSMTRNLQMMKNIRFIKEDNINLTAVNVQIQQIRLMN